MDTDKRALYFWCGCIPARVAMIVFHRQPVVKAVSAMAAIGWLSGAVKSRVGFFGGKVWWAEQRLHHGLLHASFVGTGQPVFLMVDVVYGAANWFKNSY